MCDNLFGKYVQYAVSDDFVCGGGILTHLRIWILTVVNTKITVFWFVTPCCLVDRY